MNFAYAIQKAHDGSKVNNPDATMTSKSAIQWHRSTTGLKGADGEKPEYFTHRSNRNSPGQESCSLLTTDGNLPCIKPCNQTWRHWIDRATCHQYRRNTYLCRKERKEIVDLNYQFSRLKQLHDELLSLCIEAKKTEAQGCFNFAIDIYPHSVIPY